MKLEKVITKLCKERGFSLTALAKKAGIPVQTLHHWTTGRRSINPDQLRKVASVLEVSIHYLMFEEADPYEHKSTQILEEIFKGDVRVTLERILDKK